MKMILTSECKECVYGIIDETNKAKIKVRCRLKNKEYYYGQYIPCENKWCEKWRIKKEEMNE